ncbi:MAG: alpha/beta fold hydrolase [Synechococcaceae cyanobacterium ELA263]
MGRPRALLVCVHGIGGHGVTFARLAQALTPFGYAVEALDLPGHGHSPGRRGSMRRWSDWRGAVLTVLSDVIARSPRIPCFLVGHSMGGTVVLDLALEEPEALQTLGVQGLILSNPALDAAGISSWRLVLARLLSWLWPAFTLKTGIADGAASRDLQVQAERAADPWRHNRCSARLASEFLATTDRLYQAAPHLLLPLLLLQSGADQVTPGAAAQLFFAAAGSPDKSWRLYPDSYHELYDDLDREQVFADLLAWLNSHGQ